MTTESANSFEGFPWSASNQSHSVNFWRFHQIFPLDVVPLSTNRHGSSHWVYQPSRLVRGVFCRTGPQMTCNSATFKAFSRLRLVSMEKRVNKWPWDVEKNHPRIGAYNCEGSITENLEVQKKSLEETGELHVDWWIDPMSALGLITCLFWIYF